MKRSGFLLSLFAGLILAQTACAPSGEQAASNEIAEADAGNSPAPTVHEVTIVRTEVPAPTEANGSGSADSRSDDRGSDDSVPNNPITAHAGNEIAALEADAKRIVGAFGQALKTQLMAAMQEGGPINAVGVCHAIAPALAAEASAANGVALTRVSLRHRNPQLGVPSAWQRAVLEDFDRKVAAGAAPQTLVYSEVVGDTYRFMKAIPTEAPCLACHGEAIEPALAQKLAELYPGDQATGYRLGDLRGAFSLLKPL